MIRIVKGLSTNIFSSSFSPGFHFYVICLLPSYLVSLAFFQSTLLSFHIILKSFGLLSTNLFEEMCDGRQICHSFPCLHCNPSTYIRMVQNMIERCLLLRMDREQCVKALEEHARIQPVVTLTVWNELMKENKEFFESYSPATSATLVSSDWYDIHRGDQDL